MNAVDNEKSTPLHLAVRPNSAVEMDMVTLMIKAGADIEAMDLSGRKPFDSLPQPQVGVIMWIQVLLRLIHNLI